MRRFFIALALCLGTLAAGSMLLPPDAAVAQKPKLIRLKVGASTDLNLGGAPREVSVENTEIATLEVLEDGQVRITGVAEGNTTLLGTAADGGDLVMPIMVEAKDAAPAPPPAEKK